MIEAETRLKLQSARSVMVAVSNDVFRVSHGNLSTTDAAEAVREIGMSLHDTGQGLMDEADRMDGSMPPEDLS
ncbi:hypothetical protein [Amycolatopsis sp. BJA-103]|uniref:hypothetical protein n=1 Tax=Amycolatopsis sp. BJA-103 TaxID=1911175 RepID=UPI0011AF24F1|nr:hypothetical protein [Amycolatopsis sp. BJA-103]